MISLVVGLKKIIKTIIVNNMEEIVMTIYKNNDNEFTFSSFGTWMPGVYNSIDDCFIASKMDIDKLYKLWDDILNDNTKRKIIKFDINEEE
jgi:hypothetical protein